MAEVDLQINGRSYRVGCENGQEQRLQALGAIVDRHAQALANGAGVVGDSKLFLMAALMIADELADARDRLESVGERDGASGAAGASGGALYETGALAPAADPTQGSDGGNAAEGAAADGNTAGGAPSADRDAGWIDPEIEAAFIDVMTRAADRLDQMAARIEAT